MINEERNGNEVLYFSKERTVSSTGGGISDRKLYTLDHPLMIFYFVRMRGTYLISALYCRCGSGFGIGKDPLIYEDALCHPDSRYGIEMQ
jgi:hypothetical protein